MFLRRPFPVFMLNFVMKWKIAKWEIKEKFGKMNWLKHSATLKLQIVMFSFFSCIISGKTFSKWSREIEKSIRTNVACLWLRNVLFPLRFTSISLNEFPSKFSRFCRFYIIFRDFFWFCQLLKCELVANLLCFAAWSRIKKLIGINLW